MAVKDAEPRSWTETFRAWMHPRVLTMFFFGFSAGLPILLIFSTLSVWLREAGVSRSAVTFFSWAALGYSFKFVWAPIIDRMPLPVLTRRLGRRRAWLLASQLLVMAAIFWMASVDPATSRKDLTVMALAAVLLGFSSATQDIVIDAYRIECAEQSLQGLLSASYIAGYRVGMLVAGAGSLFLAAYLGTSRSEYVYQAWRLTFAAMGFCMLVGLATTLLVPEPDRDARAVGHDYSHSKYARFFALFLCAAGGFALTFFLAGSAASWLQGKMAGLLPFSAGLSGFAFEALRLAVALTAALALARTLVWAGLVDRAMVQGTYVEPIAEFFRRYGMRTAVLVLALVGFYRISDIVLGVISNVFYLDVGFGKNEIASITKTFGLLMTLAGGFAGGMLTLRYGILRILFAGAVLSAGTNLLFMLLAMRGPDPVLLTVVIAADNLAAGLASSAFVAFLSGLTSVSFTAIQYAVFSSLMSLFPKLIGGYSGTMVSGLGYPIFFSLTAAMGLPVLLLIWLVRDLSIGTKDKGTESEPG